MISVIIPTLEEEKYLPALLKDLSSQNTRPGEIIIVDAGSKDGTLSVAKSMGAKVITSKKKSAAHQRNLGAKSAKGDLLVFIDADIRIRDPKTMEEVAARQGSFHAATARVSVITEEKLLRDTLFCAHPHLIARISPRFCGRGAFMAVDRKAFEAVGGFDEKRIVTEDVEFFRRIGKIGRVACLRSTVEESPRRYRSIGHAKVLWSWVSNAIHAAITGRSKDSEWRAIR